MEIDSNKKTEDICPGKKKLGLAEVKDKLSEARGPQYWRTLDELAQTPEFEEMLHREFPRHASEWTDKASRRDFFKIMGASMALAGLSACVKLPLQPIVPYVRQPEDIIPGKPLFFASSMPFNAYSVPVLVESHEGRPTKIEGNPQHPATLGGTDVFSQASVLTMYDPDRSQSVIYLGDTRAWGAYVNSIRGPIQQQRQKGGAGLRFLIGTSSSPTLLAQIKDIQAQYPQAKFYTWDSVNRDTAYAGAQLAFGQPVETQYNFEKAKVVLSLDGDFLSSGFPGFHRYARSFSSRRRPELKEEMLRFYAVESTPTNTSGKADHRLRLKAREVENFARAVAGMLGVGGASGSLSGEAQKFAKAVAKDIQANRGRAVVVVGDNQPAEVHAIAHGINGAIGAVGQTVSYTDALDTMASSGKIDQLKALVAEMNAGKVEFLFISGANPLYDAPADIDFLSAMDKVALRVHHGLYQDETAKYCHWHLNGTHFLEEWGDVRAFDGTVSLIQPLIAPLYDGHSQYELLSMFMGDQLLGGFEIVQSYWKAQQKTGFDGWWRKTLHDGFAENTAFTPRAMSARGVPPAKQQPTGGFELMFRRDPAIFDGRFANNGWLQEMPKPVTQVCWDNPVLISVATASKLKLETEDIVEIEANGQKVRGAVWLTPGHPDDSATVFLGYGRERCGRVGSGVGFNANKIRSSSAPWIAGGSLKAQGGEKYGFASPQGSQSMQGRNLVRAVTLEDFINEPHAIQEVGEAPAAGLTLYQPHEYKEQKWGMVIDMNSCIGCKTCTVACQSENNIPVVGKLEVKRGRHMNWLRVDNYHEGTAENPKTYYQPVPCMQCENAPCEVVCPVGATVHSAEGLNDMVYNRCVGTRYCSNNCPYKVRRFNFLLYADYETPQMKFVNNPDVTVRSRGVMEKCTYCVQRITHGRIAAEEQNRKIADGEVLTACQQACPADAIVFGDMNDPNSRVSKLKAGLRNYGLLDELNTRPRTSYLGAVRNPNPELEGENTQQHHAAAVGSRGERA